MDKRTIAIITLSSMTLLSLCVLSPLSRGAPELGSPPTPTYGHADREAPASLLQDPRARKEERLAVHLEGVMRGWAPKADAPGGLRASALGDLAAIAKDIAAVALDPAMPSFSKDESGARAGILLAAIAFFESGFRDYVDSGRCNDPAWRSSDEGRRMLAAHADCDHGIAVSIWQIHPSTLYFERLREEATAEKLRDRRYAASVALRLAYRSIEGSGSLAGYTGEDPSFCPKADARLNFAVDQADKHPLAP